MQKKGAGILASCVPVILVTMDKCTKQHIT